jgi:hypothetical protein
VGEFVFEPAAPGSWNPETDWKNALHEAGHACVALAVGLPLREARIDTPDWPSTYGWAVVGDGDHSYENLLLASLGGPLSDIPPTRPAWPLRQDGKGDETNQAIICDRLGSSEADYRRFEGLAADFLRVFRDRRGALQAALLDRGALPGDELRQIFDSGSQVPAAESEAASRQLAGASHAGLLTGSTHPRFV